MSPRADHLRKRAEGLGHARGWLDIIAQDEQIDGRIRYHAAVLAEETNRLADELTIDANHGPPELT